MTHWAFRHAVGDVPAFAVRVREAPTPAGVLVGIVLGATYPQYVTGGVVYLKELGIRDGPDDPRRREPHQGGPAARDDAAGGPRELVGAEAAPPLPEQGGPGSRTEAATPPGVRVITSLG
ncbi:hypothetical protein [Streptomyces sp. 2A115]|uniref:hypothetical protein n=1 Tax=Streptomyces sp. 2A115 TaxID=3457439 RepID=UPI003FD1CA8A